MKPEHTSPAGKKKGTAFKITIGVICFLILGAGTYAFTVYKSVSYTLNKTHEPIHRSESKQRTINFAKEDPISILLLGVDKRDGDRGRPDSMMLLTVNPRTDSIKIVSIPRDSYTEIAEKDKKDKINHAYTYGGVDMSIKTVEGFLQIPVDYYAEINMDGFLDLVESVGGVTVNNTFPFTYGGIDFPAGHLKLDGKEALLYSRMRADDPNGDFGRQERQRKIIQAFVKEALQTKTLVNYRKILDAVGNNVKTNLTFSEIKEFQADYSQASYNIEQLQIKGNGKMIDGVYYYMVPEFERNKLSNILKKHLNIE